MTHRSLPATWSSCPTLVSSCLQLPLLLLPVLCFHLRFGPRIPSQVRSEMLAAKMHGRRQTLTRCRYWRVLLVRGRGVGPIIPAQPAPPTFHETQGKVMILASCLHALICFYRHQHRSTVHVGASPSSICGLAGGISTCCVLFRVSMHYYVRQPSAAWLGVNIPVT
ncbi:hypothetical protein EJ05DRAFT_305816 [Pseudovirgaria hyperparasitica]|uniref:Uncharacterized protein n=1 Tax=Pseudovirgaria hyperparasitica TaxID=470096 RepID=A0A6A6W9Y7_9PEZI|nr:uncharacterized protein EJ05DRAFT_305816 [Pseudovirgaria hyperparasitica]KAF2759662.1 hypothetical protein EJ05DRAFT_305816 [Pseudovirgaria hyperparasitica]